MSDDAGQSGDKGDAGQGTGGGDGKIQLTQQELDAKMAEVRRGVEKSISEKYADYDDLKAKASQIDKLEESKKSAEQKLLERIEAAEKRATEAEKAVGEAKIDAIRTRVATARGLTDAQAARLQGSNIEEMEADATELFGEPQGDEPKGEKKGVVRQPRTDLKGGSDPTKHDGEVDVKKVFDEFEL